jgi:Cache domain
MRHREFITLVVGAMVVWTLPAHAQQMEAQTQLVRGSLEVQAEAVASKIAQFIEKIEARLNSWSVRPITQGRINAMKLMHEMPAISELSLIDGAGKEVFRLSRIPIDLTAIEKNNARNPKFTEAMSNKVYYGPIYFRDASEACVTLSISDTVGEVVVRVAEISLKSIQDTMRAAKVGQSGVAYVVDGHGHVFAHPDRGRVQEDFGRLDHVRSALTPGVSPPAEAMQISHDIEGREVLVYAQVAQHLGWLAFLELPTGEISVSTPPLPK